MALAEALHHLEMSRTKHFLKQWRKHRGFSQERLAESIGVSQGQYSKVENFKKPYDQVFMESAADALGCSVVDLITRPPTDPEGIWTIWMDLDGPQRQQAVELLRVIKRTSVA